MALQCPLLIQLYLYVLEGTATRKDLAHWEKLRPPARKKGEPDGPTTASDYHYDQSIEKIAPVTDKVIPDCIREQAEKAIHLKRVQADTFCRSTDE